MYEKVNIPIITKFSLKLSYFQSFLLFLIDFKDFYKTKLDSYFNYRTLYNAAK